MGRRAAFTSSASWTVAVLVVVDVAVVFVLLSAGGATDRAATALRDVPYACANEAADSLPEAARVRWPVGEPVHVAPGTFDVDATLEDGESLRVRCRVRDRSTDTEARFDLVEARVLR
ncbi:hypothetical protein [Nocardioides solisilvae]|uniref:hypothetical protein n=1 Tax=Nocardioides solisilvae TaxID=1542435 RepID=UPI000D74D301|nr:hypothetical protein [Nocardioides solisilvae]